MVIARPVKKGLRRVLSKGSRPAFREKERADGGGVQCRSSSCQSGGVRRGNLKVGPKAEVTRGNEVATSPIRQCGLEADTDEQN